MKIQIVIELNFNIDIFIFYFFLILKEAESNTRPISSQINLLKKVYSPEEMLSFAKENPPRFPTKIFDLAGKKKAYSAVTQMFHCKLEYEQIPDKIKFICKTYGCELNCKLGELTNLNKHLLTHRFSIAENWYKIYRSRVSKTETSMSPAMLNLVKLFISSYQSLTLLQNEFFISLISKI